MYGSAANQKKDTGQEKNDAQEDDAQEVGHDTSDSP